MKREIEKNVCFVSKLTSELTENDLNVFFNVFKNVFGLTNNCGWFDKKYKNNPYGDSIHVFAFVDEECVGIQCFMRNDISGVKAFQSGDSAVLPESRGLGLFKKMVNFGLKSIPEGCVVYGFPNENSLPAFLKMGWICICHMRYSLYKRKKTSELEVIESSYLDYVLKNNVNVRIARIHNSYVLLKKKSALISVVIAKVDLEKVDPIIKNSIKRVNGFKIYYSKNGWLGKGVTVIVLPRRDPSIAIPLYKMDTML